MILRHLHLPGYNTQDSFPCPPSPPALTFGPFLPHLPSLSFPPLLVYLSLISSPPPPSHPLLPFLLLSCSLSLSLTFSLYLSIVASHQLTVIITFSFWGSPAPPTLLTWSASPRGGTWNICSHLSCAHQGQDTDSFGWSSAPRLGQLCDLPSRRGRAFRPASPSWCAPTHDLL